MKIGVCFVGLNGGVATTSVAAALSIAKGISPGWGLYTETLMSTVKDGQLDRHDQKPIKDVLGLNDFSEMIFAGWDIEEGNGYQYAKELKLFSPDILEQIRSEMESIRPWKGIFSKEWIKNLDGHFVLTGSHRENAEEIRKNIRDFKMQNGISNVVVIDIASTEVYKEPVEVHQSLAAFEQGLDLSNPAIGPGMIYCYAALQEGCPWANFTPSLIEEMPALRELAEKNRVPVAGKDGKTGQTLIKTAMAPIFALKNLNVQGWFSTNILGNKDGLVLDDPGSLKSKIVSKSSVLSSILKQDNEPFHKVAINYYPPRGDNKEAWDNIDFRGILGEDMQIKVNFLCKDSILAAGNVLDLIRFLSYSKEKGDYGVQEHLSFFFKSPLTMNNKPAIHNFFKQEGMLKDYMRQKAYGVGYKG
jgi:myo-inositol-1-phosphate synthase